MTTFPLSPQAFTSQSVTQLPAFDFLAYAKTLLPQVYQIAPNFMDVVEVISANKQYLYDTIRSLINVMNLNNSGSGDAASVPSGVYLEMLASIFNSPYTVGQADYLIANSIQNTITFVNSRGLTSDFYRYFALNGLATYFNNNGVEDNNNATIFFNVPIPNTPSIPPNPYQIFYTNMFKLKAAGVEILVESGNVPFFQLGALPTDSGPPVAPGNAGFGILTPDGVVINGGFFISL